MSPQPVPVDAVALHDLHMRLHADLTQSGAQRVRVFRHTFARGCADMVVLPAKSGQPTVGAGWKLAQDGGEVEAGDRITSPYIKQSSQLC